MKIFIIFSIIAAALIFYIRYLEVALMFAPSRDIYRTPENDGLLFRDVTLTTSDKIKINGWFVLSPRTLNPSGLLEEPKRYTILYFHGNAGNIADRLERIRFFHDLGLNVFIIDYRGYGRSEGRPTEKGMYLDALAAYDHLVQKENISADEIIVYGTSLGGAAAIDLVSKRKAKCLIADSTFSNAADMAKLIVPFVPSFVLSVKLDSLSKIKQIGIPKLFIHSPDDRVVPYRFGKKLFDAAAETKIFMQITGDHNDANFDLNGPIARGLKQFFNSSGIHL